MTTENDGFQFWRRVDSLRDKNKTLKVFTEELDMNYNVVKVQRSMNRIPNADDVCKIALALEVPVEWLVQGHTRDLIDSLRIGKTREYKRLYTIMNSLTKAQPRLLSAVEFVLGIND
jgi:hypothetical protein